MKLYSILTNVIFVLCILFISACTTEPVVEPPVFVLTPTPIAPVETLVPNPTIDLVEPTQPAPLPTEVVVSKVDPTPVPPIDPPPGPDACTTPEPPDGTFYLSYWVQAGDTLFEIGQKARPNMTVDQVASANCITDVNHIEVGQELLIWHSPTTGPAGPAVTLLTFNEHAFGKSAAYSGPLPFGEHIFEFQGFAGSYLSLSSRVGRSPAVTYTLHKASDITLIGSVHSTDRYYLDPAVQGREFYLPADGTYRLTVQGDPGVPLDFNLNMLPGRTPDLGIPQRIQFAAGGTSTQILGTNVQGLFDRYVFGASVGQVVDLNVIREPNVEIWIEDSTPNLIYRTDGVKQGQFIVPTSGDYTLTVFHGGSHGYLYGDYEFSLSITDSGTTGTIPTPEPTGSIQETLVFNEGINGWLGGGATGRLDENGNRTFTFYLGGERNLALIERSGSLLNLQLEKADGTTQVGSVSTTERHFMGINMRGRDFTLPETAQYLLHITGEPNSMYDLDLIWGGAPHPTLGAPQRIQFESDTIESRITGENLLGEMDRYVFGATAGQTITIDLVQRLGNGQNAEIQIDNDSEVIMYTQLGSNQVTIPADGDYILTVWHPGGEVFGHGSYEFTLTIE